MTDQQESQATGEELSPEELGERVRPMVNEILDRFNQEHLSPAAAGMVILALTHRLMTVLEEDPEGRRYFVLTLVNMVNRYLAGEFQGD
jgi:hypothetical protein